MVDPGLGAAANALGSAVLAGRYRLIGLPRVGGREERRQVYTCFQEAALAFAMHADRHPDGRRSGGQIWRIGWWKARWAQARRRRAALPNDQLDALPGEGDDNPDAELREGDPEGWVRERPSSTA